MVLLKCEGLSFWNGSDCRGIEGAWLCYKSRKCSNYETSVTLSMEWVNITLMHDAKTKN